MTRFRGYERSVAFVAVGVAILGLGLVLKALPGTTPVVSAPRDTPNSIRRAFDASFKAGVTALQAGRPADAVEHFRKIHRIGPHVPQVQVNLGYAYLALKNFAAAERSFRAAIDLRPGQANAYYGWAESLEALGDLEAALGAMRTYIHLVPEGDPFKRKAMAAVWEWSGALKKRRAERRSSNAGKVGLETGDLKARASTAAARHEPGVDGAGR